MQTKGPIEEGIREWARMKYFEYSMLCLILESCIFPVGLEIIIRI